VTQRISHTSIQRAGSRQMRAAATHVDIMDNGIAGTSRPAAKSQHNTSLTTASYTHVRCFIDNSAVLANRCNAQSNALPLSMQEPSYGPPRADRRTRFRGWHVMQRRRDPRRCWIQWPQRMCARWDLAEQGAFSLGACDHLSTCCISRCPAPAGHATAQ
jgi:hypothetical protein